MIGAVEAAGHAAVVLVAEQRSAGPGSACRPARRSSPACRGRCRGTGCRARSRAARARSRSRRARAPCARSAARAARRRSCGSTSAPPASSRPSIEVEHEIGLGDHARVGRQHQRDAAGALDRVDVVARQQHRRLVPDAPAGLLERRADADQRRAHAHTVSTAQARHRRRRVGPSPPRPRASRAIRRSVNRIRRVAPPARPHPLPAAQRGAARRADARWRCSRFAPDALRQPPHAAARGSPNANRISDLYTITLYIAAIDLRRRRGHAALRARPLPQAQGPRRRADPRQHAPRDRLDASARPRSSSRSRSLTFAELSSIRKPDELGRRTASTCDSVAVRDHRRRDPPAQGPRYMTIQVNGQQYIWRYTYLGFGKLADQLDDPYTYYQMYVPTNTDDRPQGRLAGRRPLVVDPGARRQGPGRARLRQLELVQDPEAAATTSASARSSAAAATRA